MKQKLALACTLIHTPKLLILDEPTTGVDPVSRRDFWRILARLQREGLTILLTTPYLDEAERCQRMALMDRGRILTVSAPDALRQETGAASLELIARPKREAVEWLRAQGEVADVESFGERLHVTGQVARPPRRWDRPSARPRASLAPAGLVRWSRFARSRPPWRTSSFLVSATTALRPPTR